MNIHRLLTITLLAALLSFTGCAKSYQEGTKAAASIQNVGQEAVVGKNLVNEAVAALDGLFRSEQGNLKDQFKTYSKAVANLESQSKKVKKRVNTMESKKAWYLDHWDVQMANIENQTIRQTAEQRRKSVEEMFSNVKQELDVAGQSFAPFMSKLNDIRTALEMDLNRSGVNALKPVADQAKADAEIINTHLDSAISVLDKAFKALSGNGG